MSHCIYEYTSHKCTCVCLLHADVQSRCSECMFMCKCVCYSFSIHVPPMYMSVCLYHSATWTTIRIAMCLRFDSRHYYVCQTICLPLEITYTHWRSNAVGVSHVCALENCKRFDCTSPMSGAFGQNCTVAYTYVHAYVYTYVNMRPYAIRPDYEYT
jgi:hypothetical protein